jgi:hypothetical protein
MNEQIDCSHGNDNRWGFHDCDKCILDILNNGNNFNKIRIK